MDMSSFYTLQERHTNQCRPTLVADVDIGTSLSLWVDCSLDYPFGVSANHLLISTGSSIHLQPRHMSATADLDPSPCQLACIYHESAGGKMLVYLR